MGHIRPPPWKTITQKKISIFKKNFFHFRCILLQISTKKCFFISISILGRSGVNVSNGVRQGRVLSPNVFTIYVDDLSSELTLCKSGCYIDDLCINHVMYAVAICLMASSVIDLQKC